MKMTVRRLDIEAVLICLTFYEPTVLPHYLFLLYKYLLLLYLFIKYFKNVFSEKMIHSSIFLYGGITIISTIINHMSLNTIISAIFYMIQIVDIFDFIIEYLKKYSFENLIRCVTILFLIICLLTDILMLFVGYNFTDSAEEYLMGNKFVVSYLHCFTLTMLGCFTDSKKKHNKLLQCSWIVVFLILSVYVSTAVSCTTGVICIVVAAILLMMSKTKMGFAMSGRTLILITAVMNILIFGSYSILTHPKVQELVTNIFHKNVSLTGRLPIYAILINTVKKSPIIGYGYFNNVIESILNYGNAQNGIMKILIDSGIAGLVGYTGIIYFGLNKKSQKSEIYWPLFSFLYAMIVASAVEINLTHMFVFFTIALISSSSRLTESARR